MDDGRGRPPWNPSWQPSWPPTFKRSAVNQYRNNLSSVESSTAPCHAGTFLGANSLPAWPAFPSPYLDSGRRGINVLNPLVDVEETNQRNPADFWFPPSNGMLQSPQIGAEGTNDVALTVCEHDGTTGVRATPFVSLTKQANELLPFNQLNLVEAIDDTGNDERLDILCTEMFGNTSKNVPHIYEERHHEHEQYFNQQANTHQQGTHWCPSLNNAMACKRFTTRGHASCIPSHHDASSRLGGLPRGINLDTPFLSDIGPREFQKWQTIGELSKTLSRYPSTSDYMKLLDSGNQLPNDLAFGNPAGEVPLFHGDGERGDEAATSHHQQQSLYGENDPNVQRSEFVEELDQVTSKKKRKKATNAVECMNESSKQCKCRKSKCLKLYCECFAAGIYCCGSCECEDCFNASDHEDIVLEARQQIVSRDHLAFFPKVVGGVDSPSAFMESGNSANPSPARHKRGCNCKKSMCQKKYCDCFQAMVGCSDVCRCEACRNVHGSKAAHGSAEKKEQLHESAERRKKPVKEKFSGSMQGMANGIETEADDRFSPFFKAILNGNDDFLASDPCADLGAYSNPEMRENSELVQSRGDEGNIPQSSSASVNLPPLPTDMTLSDGNQAFPGFKPESCMPGMANSVDDHDIIASPPSKLVNARPLDQESAPGESSGISPNLRSARQQGFSDVPYLPHINDYKR